MEEKSALPKKESSSSLLVEPKVKIQLSKKGFFTILIALTTLWSLFLIYLVVVGIGLYALNWRSIWVKKTTAVIPYPAAWVNVEPITFSKLFQQKTHIVQFFRQTGSQLPDDKDLEQRTLDLLIREKVVEKLAVVYNLRVGQEELDKALNQLYEENGGQKSFEEILWQFYGFTPTEIKNLVRFSLKQEKLINYYEDNLRKKVHLAHILLSEENKAKEIASQAKKGADFSELAKKNSTDKETKTKGGDLGYFAPDELVRVIAKDKTADKKQLEDFKKKVWSAKENSVLVFHTNRGWQVVKVLDFRGTEDREFDDWLQDQIEQSFVLRFI